MAKVKPLRGIRRTADNKESTYGRDPLIRKGVLMSIMLSERKGLLFVGKDEDSTTVFLDVRSVTRTHDLVELTVISSPERDNQAFREIQAFLEADGKADRDFYCAEEAWGFNLGMNTVAKYGCIVKDENDRPVHFVSFSNPEWVSVPGTGIEYKVLQAALSELSRRLEINGQALKDGALTGAISGNKKAAPRTDGVACGTCRGWYIVRHWQGQLALPTAYWGNTVLITLSLVAVLSVIPWDSLVTKSPTLFSITLISLWLFMALTSVWQYVGVWRSARHHMDQGKSKLGGNLARIAVILGLLTGAGKFVSAGIPQISEFANIAVGKDPVGTYQLRLLRDGTELEIAGSMAFGLTDKVSQTLDMNSAVRVIHLNSVGGRVNEARKLRDLIASRGLTTYTASGCSSACTLAFVAGQKRLIARNAALGFHQYSFPGIKGHEFRAEYEKDKQDWLGRGIANAFVNTAFTTPNSQMWRPSHRELFEARMITGYPEGDDVGISGVKLTDLENIDAEFVKIPLFSALKMYERAAYDRLLSQVRSGVQEGRSLAEMQKQIFPLVHSIYMKKLPYASDPALRAFGRLLLEQMKVLYSVDPTLCYAFIHGENSETNADATKYFSDELRQRALSVMAEVIRSAGEGSFQPPSRQQIEGQLKSVFTVLTKRFGADVRMLNDRELGKANKPRTCEIAYELYREILVLPEQDSGQVLRFMFASVAT